MNDIETVRVAGKNALAELDRLRRDYARSGLYPVLFGDEEDFERVVENYDLTANEGLTSEEIAACSLQTDAPDWFATRIAEEPDLYSTELGDWPSSAGEKMGIITQNDILSGKPHPSVVIGLLRVTRPWEVFAVLRWGDWNACPSAAEHCAIHRYWFDKFGAEVVSVTGDVVQCVVNKPPRTREASLALAREHYVYCYDIVVQGTQTIANLGAALLDSRYWYFWWD